MSTMNNKKNCPECGNIKKTISERCITCANTRSQLKSKKKYEELKLKRISDKESLEKKP